MYTCHGVGHAASAQGGAITGKRKPEKSILTPRRLARRLDNCARPNMRCSEALLSQKHGVRNSVRVSTLAFAFEHLGAGSMKRLTVLCPLTNEMQWLGSCLRSVLRGFPKRAASASASTEASVFGCFGLASIVCGDSTPMLTGDLPEQHGSACCRGAKASSLAFASVATDTAAACGRLRPAWRNQPRVAFTTSAKLRWWGVWTHVCRLTRPHA